MALSITRAKRDVKRLRLERSLLLEKLEERTLLKVDDSDGSPSPPSSPTLSALDAVIPNVKKNVGGASTPRSKSPGTDDHGSPTPSRSGFTSANKKSSRRSTNGKDNNDGAEGDGAEDDEPNEHVAAPSTPANPTKKKPPPRDPNLPKRPQNAYIIFCDLEKERVKREVEEAHPGHPFDLTKAMAEKWHELTDIERQRYFQIYEDDKERYAREMVACHLPNPSPSEQKEKQRAVKTLRDIERLRKEGRRPPIVSGSPLAKMIEATSGSAAAAKAIAGAGCPSPVVSNAPEVSVKDEETASAPTENDSPSEPAVKSESGDVEMKDS